MGNEIRFENAFSMKFTLDAMSENELPSACISCGACKQLCPQNIDIPDALGRFARALER